MMAVKQRILKAIEELPDDTTFDEAIERLHFVSQLERRLEDLDAGGAISHEEARRRLSAWLT